jgi:hypothetical protein
MAKTTQSKKTPQAYIVYEARFAVPVDLEDGKLTENVEYEAAKKIRYAIGGFGAVHAIEGGWVRPIQSCSVCLVAITEDDDAVPDGHGGKRCDYACKRPKDVAEAIKPADLDRSLFEE